MKQKKNTLLRRLFSNGTHADPGDPIPPEDSETSTTTRLSESSDPSPEPAPEEPTTTTAKASTVQPDPEKSSKTSAQSGHPHAGSSPKTKSSSNSTEQHVKTPSGVAPHFADVNTKSKYLSLKGKYSTKELNSKSPAERLKYNVSSL